MSGDRPLVGVLDHGSGNLHSACRALDAAGARVRLSSRPDGFADCRGLVVPGVGAFEACMDELEAGGGADLVRAWAAVSRPLLGICVGHQVLFDSGDEHGRTTAVLVGGASASADLLGRARSAGIAVVTTYGMTETGGGCVYDGVALEGVRVRVEGPEGRIVISGPVVAQGYVGDAGGGCEFRQGPWGREVWTCDRGRVGADGRLTVLGRLDDIIVTGGLKVDPHLVESVLTSIDGVCQACVVGVEDQEWGSVVAAAVVPAPGSRPDAQEVRRAARALLDGVHTPKRVRVLPALPLRGPGKVDRRAVAQLLVGDVSGAP